MNLYLIIGGTAVAVLFAVAAFFYIKKLGKEQKEIDYLKDTLNMVAKKNELKADISNRDSNTFNYRD